jgi:hypothetical protein
LVFQYFELFFIDSCGSSLFLSFGSGQNSYPQNIVNQDSTQQIAALLSGVNFSFKIGAK